MRIPSSRAPLAALLAAGVLLAACGGDDDETSDATTTTVDEPETTTTVGEDDGADEDLDEDTDPAPTGNDTAAVPGAEEDPTAYLLDDKAILLDGFLGVRIPDGWAVTTAVAPEPSVSPPGGETEVDPDAIDQLLVIGPEADPRAATFALLQYSHSDSVPGLVEFTAGIQGLLGADGTQFTEAQTARIGGQEALLHQLQQPDGDNGIFVTLVADGEYFFLLSIVSDDGYADDAGDLIASISLEPAAIG